MAIKITLKELRDIIAQEIKSIREDIVAGGLSDYMSVKDIANKHNLSVDQIVSQMKKGIAVEREHTDDIKLAAEIALDHLFEDPKYYDKLAKMENPSTDEISHRFSNNADKYRHSKNNK